MDLEQIIQERDKKQKELTALLTSKAVIDEQYGNLALELAKLEVKKKEMMIAKQKVGALIQVLRIEIENLKDGYWNAKNQ